MKSKFLFWGFGSIILIVTLMLLNACGTTTVQNAPVATSGNVVPTPNPVPPGGEGNYAPNYALSAVTTIYTITGVVQAAPGSVSQYNIHGSMSGSSYNGYGSVSGYVSGGTSGKGIIRFLVEDMHYHDPYVDAGVTKRNEDWTPIVTPGQIIILKSEDTKATGLAAGDRVTFMCREEVEFVHAVAQNEIPTLRSVTRELDWCRMVEPAFTPPAQE